MKRAAHIPGSNQKKTIGKVSGVCLGALLVLALGACEARDYNYEAMSSFPTAWQRVQTSGLPGEIQAGDRMPKLGRIPESISGDYICSGYESEVLIGSTQRYLYKISSNTAGIIDDGDRESGSAFRERLKITWMASNEARYVRFDGRGLPVVYFGGNSARPVEAGGSQYLCFDMYLSNRIESVNEKGKYQVLDQYLCDHGLDLRDMSYVRVVYGDADADEEGRRAAHARIGQCTKQEQSGD